MHLCDLDLHPCGGHLASTDRSLFGKTQARVLLVLDWAPGSKWWLPRHSWVTLCWLNWGVLMLNASLICSHSYWVWAMVWNMTALPGAESPLLKDWNYRPKEGFLQPYLPEPANTKTTSTQNLNTLILQTLIYFPNKSMQPFQFSPSLEWVVLWWL